MALKTSLSDGLTISYRTAGNGDLAIIFIHGFGATSIVWKNQVKSLSETATIVAPDLRGWGYSSKPKGNRYRIQDHMNDITNLVSSLGLDKFVLAGSSMGGLLALSYYFRNRNKVKALLLVGTRARARKDLDGLIQRARSSEYKKIIREAALNSFSGNSQKAAQNQVLIGAMRATRDCVLHTLEAFRNFDLTDRITQIDIPTLIIFGREDNITPINEALYLNRKIENSSLELIDHSGHLPMFERPDEFNQSVRHFLSDLSATQ